MLYKSNSATHERTEFEMCLLTAKFIACVCVLYYSVLALYAIENGYNTNDINNVLCNDTRITILVCITIIVSVGMILSYYCYNRRKTELRLAICILFTLSIFGLYGLLFSELYKSVFNKCNVDLKYEKDIHLISWIWINLISLLVFVLFVGMIGYIIYLHKYNISRNQMSSVSSSTSYVKEPPVSIQGTSLTVNLTTDKKINNYLQSIFENEHEHEL